MTRLLSTAARYARSRGLVRDGVELDIVGDPVGARLNAAVRRLILLAQDDLNGLWDDVLGPSKSLRWRMLTQPQPALFGTSVQQACAEVVTKAQEFRPAVDGEAQRLLDELAAAAEAVVETDPAAGAVLFESITEATPEACVVIAASAASAAGLKGWLSPQAFRVRTVAELLREQLFVECGYAVGPPRVFPSSLVSAPMTETLNFVFPAWYSDRALPRSPLASWAEGAIRIRGNDCQIGDVTQPEMTYDEEIDEEAMLPQSASIAPDAPLRAPGPDEVNARCVHLSGGYRMWLDDDGEWIRAVDPSQPGGARVVNIDIEEVRPGVYLLLRDGQTERGALYEAALELMGPQRKAVEASQAAWKGALKDRLEQEGRPAVMRQLAEAGVRTLERVPAWTKPLLARPRSNQDFERLLQWLGVPIHPTYELATALRSLRIRASNKIGDQLEAAVTSADMSRLERDGYLRLEVDAEGFRGIIATRVIDISPYPQTVPHYEARVLQPDRSATWRE
jgi:hypothetical protein